jgi:hypothetical protein
VLTALEIERQNVAAHALRLTTLGPGQGTAGLVYLPANYHASAVRLFIDVGGQHFRFPFRQTVYGQPDTVTRAEPVAPQRRPYRPGFRTGPTTSSTDALAVGRAATPP